MYLEVFVVIKLKKALNFAHRIAEDAFRAFGRKTHGHNIIHNVAQIQIEPILLKPTQMSRTVTLLLLA